MADRVTASSVDLPADMPMDMKERLYADVALIGNCFYRETEDGYERVPPRLMTRCSGCGGWHHFLIGSC